MTFPEVDHPTKLPIVSRQAHERRPHRWIGVHCKEMHQEGKSLDPIPGPQVQLGMRVEVQPSGRTKGLLNLPRHYLGAASAAPNSAALSGSIPKAPGSAGGYLLPLCFRSSCRDVLRCITNFESGALGVKRRASRATHHRARTRAIHTLDLRSAGRQHARL